MQGCMITLKACSTCISDTEQAIPLEFAQVTCINVRLTFPVFVILKSMVQP